MTVPETRNAESRMTEEYKVLHEVAQVLQSDGGVQDRLERVMQVITRFHDLRVEKKAGIFLADEKTQTLHLYSTIGQFTDEFLHGEKEVPFGDCLCGRVAASGEILMSNSCFADPRHERKYDGMTPHGHYIVPLKSQNKLVGVMFLYTDTDPSWYTHSREVLLSIGGLIGDAIQRSRQEEKLKSSNEALKREVGERRKVEAELVTYRDHLEELVAQRTQDLTAANEQLKDEIQVRKHTESKLKQIRQQLRELNRRLQNIREEEKSRIARQVHDELGQSLTALKMEVAYLEKKYGGIPGFPGEKTESMKRLIDTTVQAVQRISTELRPPILDAFGICDAIAWQAEETHRRAGIRFDLNCLQPGVQLDTNLATTLFRIFQEALTNIVRHAQADKVRVSLSRTKSGLTLEVADNGRGIDPGKIKDPKSLGLLGIRERLLPWDGTLSIQGKPGAGTTVRVEIALPEEETTQRS